MAAVRRQALDRGDLRAVDMDGTGTVLRLAAAELGAHEPDLVAQGPQEWHLGLDVEIVAAAIHRQRNHGWPPKRRCLAVEDRPGPLPTKGARAGARYSSF